MQASALMQLFLRPNSNAVLRSSASGAAEDAASSARQDMWMEHDFNNDDDDTFGGNGDSICELQPKLACMAASFCALDRCSTLVIPSLRISSQFSKTCGCMRSYDGKLRCRASRGGVG